jgi:uncharacterized protein YrrD
MNKLKDTSWKYSVLVGMPVYERLTQCKIGRVHDIIMNFDKILGVAIGFNNIIGIMKFISVSEIVEVNYGSIVVKSSYSVQKCDKDSGIFKIYCSHNYFKINRFVLKNIDDLLGVVKDLILDLESNRVLKVIISQGLCDDLKSYVLGINCDDLNISNNYIYFRKKNKE